MSKVWEILSYLWRWRCLTWWRKVVVVLEECGDEYILPEYTMSTPSTKLYITATKLPTPKHLRPAKRYRLSRPSSNTRISTNNFHLPCTRISLIPRRSLQQTQSTTSSSNGFMSCQLCRQDPWLVPRTLLLRILEGIW